MDFRLLYFLSIAVTWFGVLAGAYEDHAAENDRLQRHRRQSGAGGAYSSSGTFAWWKIVLVVGGGLVGMEILYCCCKNYLRKQGSDENQNQNSKKNKIRENSSEFAGTINENTKSSMRKNNSFVEAMKPGYTNLRDPCVELYYPSLKTPCMSTTISPQQKNTFYVEQPLAVQNMQYTHHLIPVTDESVPQWGTKMHPLLGASTFV